ncbi:MAG TPA: hypothetical protein PKD24_09410 [Pyrinomonadaceae bacterium]|nr:hypothetical protein [Pyrinomonadaceae bacterium]HMP65714.1 hypothetical protein [Pyrinomonadaceae bacterium]
MDSDQVKIPTNHSEWESFIAAWIAAEESGKRRSDDDPEWWAVDAALEWLFDDLHEQLWEFILRIFERKMSDRVFASLAAGPLEDLLGSFGDLYIDRVEELARKNPRFNHLLGGVWKNAMTADVWDRVQKARLAVW